MRGKKARSSYACDLIEQARQNHPVPSHSHPHEFSVVAENAAQLSRHIGMDLLAHRVTAHAPHGTVAPWPPVEHQCQGDPLWHAWVGRPVFGVVASVHRASQTYCRGSSGTIRLFCSAQKRAQQEQEEHSAADIARELRSSCDAFTDFPCRPHVAGEVWSTLGHGTIPRRNCREPCVEAARRGDDLGR